MPVALLKPTEQRRTGTGRVYQIRCLFALMTARSFDDGSQPGTAIVGHLTHQFDRKPGCCTRMTPREAGITSRDNTIHDPRLICKTSIGSNPGGASNFQFNFNRLCAGWHERVPSNGLRWTTNQQSATLAVPQIVDPERVDGWRFRQEEDSRTSTPQ